LYATGFDRRLLDSYHNDWTIIDFRLLKKRH
jgi:hypothetical protein